MPKEMKESFEKIPKDKRFKCPKHGEDVKFVKRDFKEKDRELNGNYCKECWDEPARELNKLE